MVLATLSGILFGAFVAHDYDKWHTLGRDAFLSHQSHRYDVYMASPSAVSSISAAVWTIVIIALYEGAVALVLKLVSR
jgi:hypothetical protein